MKVEYIGVYRDGTGYGKAAQDHILSIDSAGIEVVPRFVKLNGINGSFSDRIKQLENNSLNNVTHIIQHYLPNMFTYKKGVQNIGVFAYETDSIRPSDWHIFCNLMDKIVVFCEQNKKMCIDSGVTKPVFVIPQSIDESRFDEKKLSRLDNLGTSNKYVFYAIGDFSSRKNYTSLIRTYLDTFKRSDNVVLILKTFISGMSPKQSLQEITNIINAIKNKLRKYTYNAYPEIIILPEYLTDEQILNLHYTGNCFVSVEKGAATCLPAMDALAIGNDVLVPKWGGPVDFAPEKSFINGSMEHCFGMDNCPQTNLYTSYEKWFCIDENELKQKMLLLYQNYLLSNNKNKMINKDFILKFNHSTIGQKWKEVLNA